jgi:hypothetical protein
MWGDAGRKEVQRSVVWDRRSRANVPKRRSGRYGEIGRYEHSAAVPIHDGTGWSGRERWAVTGMTGHNRHTRCDEARQDTTGHNGRHGWPSVTVLCSYPTICHPFTVPFIRYRFHPFARAYVTALATLPCASVGRPLPVHPSVRYPFIPPCSRSPYSTGSLPNKA